MTNLSHIGGILPILYTFFDDDGRVRPGSFARQVEHSLDAGAPGIVLFGFVTQFYRLTFDEKVAIMAECSEALAGRGSFGITVMDSNVEGQVALVQAAERLNADYFIFQPPLGPPGHAPRWQEMVVEVAKATELPVGIQNAPIAGTVLTAQQLVALQERVPHLTIIKAEDASENVASFSRDHGDRFRILTGNWGVEYPFFAENGAHGLIPAPNFVPEQVALHAALEKGEDGFAEAMAIHGRILPLMQFLRCRENAESQFLLGKRALARRLGMKSCQGRLPGPVRADSAIEAHVDRLAEMLES